jgi:receptor-type tyrosine-protein phosphatase Q
MQAFVKCGMEIIIPIFCVLCIALTTAPSSPPINVNIRQVTSISFMLSWSAPPLREQNGLIRHYSVRCIHQEGDFEILTDSLTERLITNLHPFYNYTCSVAAVTIAPGPYSSTLLVTTLEDGKRYSVLFFSGHS